MLVSEVVLFIEQFQCVDFGMVDVVEFEVVVQWLFVLFCFVWWVGQQMLIGNNDQVVGELEVVIKVDFYLGLNGFFGCE